MTHNSAYNQYLELSAKETRLKRDVQALKYTKGLPKLAFYDITHEVVLTEYELELIKADRIKQLEKIEAEIEKIKVQF